MTTIRVFALIVLAGALGAMNAVFAMSVKPPSFQELVAGAEQVLRTEVLDTRCVWKGEGAQRHIVTLVKVRVEKAILGTAPREMELELLGGQIGEEGLEVGGMTLFHKGDRDIVFVAGNGKNFCPLVAVNYGRYFLVPNAAKTGEFVSRADSSPLHSVDEVSREMDRVSVASSQIADSGALSSQAFEDKIIACAQGLKKPEPVLK